MSFQRDGYELRPGLLDAAAISVLDLGPESLSMPHRTHPQVAYIMRRPDIVEMVEAILGPASGLGSDYYNASPRLGWHQDAGYTLCRPEAMLSVWIALADVGDDNCLEVCPRSHTNGLYLAEEFPEVAIAYYAQTIPCKAGDAILLHGDLVHRSRPTQSDAPRPTLLLTYIKQGYPFRPGPKQNRAEVPLR